MCSRRMSHNLSLLSVILEVHSQVNPRDSEKVVILTDLTFKGPCILICSYNERQPDALFLKFILQSTLHVSDMSTVHHQEYLNTVYTQ